MRYARINFGCGVAELWGDFDVASVEEFFERHASQCFGIRKSITDFRLEHIELADHIPPPWGRLPGAVTMLSHSGDTIVWDAEGEKIKSEWD